MLPNLDKLVEKCRAIGKEPVASGKRLSKDDCVKILREYHLPEGGLPYTELTPMLCFAEWNLKPEEQAKVWKSPTWVAQRKLNGCRLIMHFVAGKGVYAHSRTISLKTWRFQELTQQLLFRDFVPDFDATIDCEVIVEKPIDTRGYTAKGELTKTSLHSTTALLHLEPEASRKVQIEQDAPLTVQVFDIPKIDDFDLRPAKLSQRLKYLQVFMDRISVTDVAKYFQFVPVTAEDKRGYFEKIVKEGGEGVILKNLNATYEDSSSRSRDGWIKVKKRIEYDAFVSGFKPGEPGSGWEKLVGALEFSVHTKDGKDHVIGYASNLPLELRKAMTIGGGTEPAPRLDQKWMGRVAEISGQDISARELRLSHCTLDRWRYEDGPDFKDESQCVVDMADLRSKAEWVG